MKKQEYMANLPSLEEDTGEAALLGDGLTRHGRFFILSQQFCEAFRD
jgi:hypothetical protein